MNNLPFHKSWILLYNGSNLERMFPSVLDKVVRLSYAIFLLVPLLPFTLKYLPGDDTHVREKENP